MAAFVPISDLFDLGGKRAMVTGAGRGIGQAVALRLAEAGATVIVHDLTEGQCAETADRIAAGGGRVEIACGDLADADGIAGMVERAAGPDGIDILVNNAALRGFTTWDTLTSAEWDRYMAVNLKAAFFTAQAVARRIQAAGKGGAIVNIASTAAERPVPQKVDYTAAKAGVAGLTRSLAVELGPLGIRVNAVGPGATETQGGKGNPVGAAAGQFQAAWVARLAIADRYAEPDDIARAVLFLASPAASYITGQTLYVDAGYLVG